jgi:hypothetical protein
VYYIILSGNEAITDRAAYRVGLAYFGQLRELGVISPANEEL